MKSIIGFLHNSNLHAIISTLLIINLHWVFKFLFAILEDIYNNVVLVNILLSHNHLSTEINSFCIWTQEDRKRDNLLKGGGGEGAL